MTDICEIVKSNPYSERAEIERLQTKMLRNIVRWAYDRSPFYRKLYDEAGVNHESIKDLSDITRLPAISKHDLRHDVENHPVYGSMLAVPEEDIVYVASSSGTSGLPLISPFTRRDFSEIVRLSRRFFEGFGMKRGDRYMHCLNLSLFVASPAVLSMQDIGVTTLWGGVLPKERIKRLLCELKITAIQTTPSFALRLGVWLKENGADPAGLSVRRIIVAGEPGGSIPAIRDAIEKTWNASVYEVYGMSEIMGSLAASCEARHGLHVAEDSVVVEVLDPESGEPLEDGKRGELTFTALMKFGRPMIRYRSGDIGTITHEKCSCGRTHARINVVGRHDNSMFIVSGVNVYPSDILSVMAGIPGITKDVRIRLQSACGTDRYIIEAERAPGCIENDRVLSERISNRLKELILAKPQAVVILQPGALSSEEQKMKYLIDERKKIDGTGRRE